MRKGFNQYNRMFAPENLKIMRYCRRCQEMKIIGKETREDINGTPRCNYCGGLLATKPLRSRIIADSLPKVDIK